jgi:iron complex transport system ATP-binding protein
MKPRSSNRKKERNSPVIDQDKEFFMTILKVRNLSAGYEEDLVIRDISFTLEEGEWVSILGPNGSGKSTLIKALQSLLKNTSGSVTMDSQEILPLGPSEIAKKFAYVPQIFDFPFEFSVEEIILMGRYIHQGRLSGSSPEDRKIIAEVMDLTRVSHLRGKKLAHLSGGERQRVFIARALAQDAPFLFLDEPSSHLDISYQIEIYQILKHLQEETGKTILSAEHNINLTIPYSQRLIFLKNGRLFGQGPPREMITKENIKDVFQAVVDIRENPLSRLPEISLHPKLQVKG